MKTGPSMAQGAQPIHGRIVLSDGTRVAYYDRVGQGPCLFLVPGSWGDYRIFDRVVQSLPCHFRIVIVELRGHGDSWPPTLAGSIELFAEDVLRVVDALAVPRFYVGGHSIGGMIAIEIAGRRADTLSGAIAIEGWTHHTVYHDAFGGMPEPELTPTEAKEHEENRARVMNRLTQEQVQAFASVWKRWNGNPILETTPVPILEIWGDRGRTPPSRAMMKIPDRPTIDLVWIANASHHLLIQRPAEVAEAIALFIARVERDTKLDG